MLTQKGKTKMKQLLTVLGAVISAAAVSEARVFDDSKFWFYGGTDRDASGVFKTGDFSDAFHVANPSHALNQQTIYGRTEAGNPQSATTTLQEIALPMTGERKTLRVVSLPQYARPNGGNTDFAFWPNSCDFSVAGATLCTTDSYTFVWRMKRHGLSHGKTKSYIMKGYNYDPARGFDLMLDGNGYLTTYSRYRETWKAWGDVLIPDEEWVDLAVVVKGTNFDGADSTLYLKTSSGEFVKYDAVGKFWGNMCLATTAQNDRSLEIFHNIRQASERWLASSSGWGLEFGLPVEFQQFAVWDRCLEDFEVREAFGFTDGHVQEVGRIDGSSDDLAGGKVASYVVENTGDWSGAPSVIAAKSEIEYTFTISRLDPSFAFVVGTANGSPDGDFEVVFNGMESIAKRIKGGRPSVFVARSKYYKIGENKIVLKRTDSGADISLDAIRLESTWMLGVRDNLWNEFGNMGSVGDTYDVRSNSELKSVRNGIRYSTQYPQLRNSTYRVPFSKEVAENCTVSYTVPMIAWGHNDSYPAVIHLLVNGVEKLTVNSADLVGKYAEVTAKLMPGELKAGLNEFAWKITGTSTDNNPTIGFDCHKFELKHDGKGLFIVVQ